MSEEPCPCGGTDEPNAVREETAGEWIDAPSPLDAELPRGLQSALGRFLGSEPVETLGEWATAVRRHTGGSISVEELCLTDGPTDHWGAVDGERRYFACFYDAVILAALSERPVDVRTESPGGQVVDARALGSDDLTVTPAGAVFSFGVEELDEPPADDGPTLERGYAAICPYVRAFPDREAYERWAERAPAATVAMPLRGATELATALVNGSSA